MSVSYSFSEEGSGVSTPTDERTARTVEETKTCPECAGRVVSEGIERVCTDCGLVVAEAAMQRKPGVHARGPSSRDSSDRWAVEPTNQLRVDKGLHTTFYLRKDGYGNNLTTEQFNKWARLKTRHERFTMHDDREKRLNEGFRDIGMLGANLAIPEFVCIQATRYLREAKREELPGGRMAW